MATLRLQYLSDPKILRSIEAKRLIPLLTPHADYLRERGLELPSATEAAQLDLEQLADIVATPRSDTPQSLLDALFMINELSTRRGMESLIAAAARAGIPLVGDGKLAPADVAVQIWLHSPSIVEEQHARVLLSRPRRFDSFQSRVGKAVTSFAPFAKHIAAVEHDLDNWGEPKQLGRGTRVFMFPADHELRFLIRRGDPYRREESLDDGNVSSVFYRPLKYDVVVYDLRADELRINTSMPSAKPIYCRAFGKHLFGDPDRFPGVSKYTLQPLLDLGEDALACGDVEGIEWIKLVKVHFLIGGPEDEYAIRGATDFFAALTHRGAAFPSQYRMAEATFRVKFEDSKTPRSMRICPGNVAAYMRDSDAELAERWMTLRGFILSVAAQQHDPDDASLAVA